MLSDNIAAILRTTASCLVEKFVMQQTCNKLVAQVHIKHALWQACLNIQSLCKLVTSELSKLVRSLLGTYKFDQACSYLNKYISSNSYVLVSSLIIFQEVFTKSSANSKNILADFWLFSGGRSCIFS